MSAPMFTENLSLAKRLKLSRELCDLDQAQMGERLGAARTTVSSWERGASEPSATHFVMWARITGQSLEWLAEGVVRPERLELPTFWMGADAGFWTAERVVEWESLTSELTEAVAS